MHFFAGKMSRKEQIGFQSGAAILLLSAVIVKIIGALFKIPISSSFCLNDKGFGYFSYAYDFRFSKYGFHHDTQTRVQSYNFFCIYANFCPKKIQILIV